MIKSFNTLRLVGEPGNAVVDQVPVTGENLYAVLPLIITASPVPVTPMSIDAAVPPESAIDEN